MASSWGGFPSSALHSHLILPKAGTFLGAGGCPASPKALLLLVTTFEYTRERVLLHPAQQRPPAVRLTPSASSLRAGTRIFGRATNRCVGSATQLNITNVCGLQTRT